jgi:hypothetical protein
MEPTIERIQKLIADAQIKISDHGYDELSADGLMAGEIIAGVNQAVVVEDYPEYAKGPCVLVVQRDGQDQPVHVLWGVPSGKTGPAVLITAYRPDPARWSADFMRRTP